jgi:hypothetical protein
MVSNSLFRGGTFECSMRSADSDLFRIAGGKSSDGNERPARITLLSGEAYRSSSHPLARAARYDRITYNRARTLGRRKDC